MYYTFPDYINEFRCTDADCPDTCCAGWKICVDRGSLSRYRDVRGKYLFKVLGSVDFLNHTFRQSRDGKCAFLREDGLCDMYMNLGPDALCRTCRNYPKRVERYENVREVTLSLSCPEVAKLLMNRKDPVRFVYREDEITEEIEGSDPFLYDAISELRSAIIKILQDRTLDIESRAGLAYAICNDVQVKINSRKLFEIADVPKKYSNGKAADHVKARTGNFLESREIYFQEMRSAFLNLYGFETLKADWPGMVLRTEQFLYNEGADSYTERTAAFNRWRREDGLFDIQLEQLLVYYVSAYFDRAANDGDVLSGIHMALVPAAIIHELALSHWLRNREQLSGDDMARIVYRFAREIEHSDINLKLLGTLRFTGEKN